MHRLQRAADLRNGLGGGSRRQWPLLPDLIGQGVAANELHADADSSRSGIGAEDRYDVWMTHAGEQWTFFDGR